MVIFRVLNSRIIWSNIIEVKLMESLKKFFIVGSFDYYLLSTCHNMQGLLFDFQLLNVTDFYLSE